MCLFRRTASIAALFCILAGLAARAEAASPEEDYWAIRSQEMARLQALAKAKPDDPKTMKLERAALADLKRRVIEIVGPVHVEGFAGAPRSHLDGLIENPDFGSIDGVEFLAGDGDLVVTTEGLLRRWLKEWSKPRAPAWTRDALKADEFYGYALNPEDGYEGVLDLKLQTPASASFAAAKLGRWGLHTDSIQEPTLIVTVVKGGRLFIYVTTVAERDLEPPECAAIDEAATADSDLKKANPEWFGPMHNPDGEGGGGFKDWRACERRLLPRAAPYKELTRKAQEIADRLNQAK